MQITIQGSLFLGSDPTALKQTLVDWAEKAKKQAGFAKITLFYDGYRKSLPEEKGDTWENRTITVYITEEGVPLSQSYFGPSDFEKDVEEINKYVRERKGPFLVVVQAFSLSNKDDVLSSYEWKVAS